MADRSRSGGRGARSWPRPAAATSRGTAVLKSCAIRRSI